MIDRRSAVSIVMDTTIISSKNNTIYDTVLNALKVQVEIIYRVR